MVSGIFKSDRFRSRDEDFAGGSQITVGSVAFLTTGHPYGDFHQSSKVPFSFLPEQAKEPRIIW